MINARCGHCKFFLHATIATSRCGRKGTKRHILNSACKDFEPKPQPLKPIYHVKKLSDA